MNLLIDDKSQTSTILDCLRCHEDSKPQTVAFRLLKDGETESATITYAELSRRVRCIAGCLQAHGIQAGDRALLLYPSSIEFIVAFLGCLSAGVIAVPTYTPKSKRHLPRLQAIAMDAKASVVLTNCKILSERNRKFAYPPEIEHLPWAETDTDQWPEVFTTTEVGHESLAFLQYTSGSTSQPKGVMVSHGNILHNERVIESALEHTAQTVYASWLPLFHDMGLIGNVLQPIYLGVLCVLMPPVAFLQSPVRWLQAISNYGVTTSGGPNFAYDLCVKKVSAAQKETLDLSSWSIAFSGSEPVRQQTLERFSAAFSRCGFRSKSFYPCYGMAETTLMVTGGDKTAAPMVRSFNKSALKKGKAQLAKQSIDSAESPDAQIFVSNGRPILDLEMAIVHPETCTPCEPNHIGEIWISGESVAQGYWRQPKQTQHTFDAALSAQPNAKFLRTGDLGFLYEDELFFAGRLKDLILIRGQNYYPQDIELTVEESHSAVRAHCSAAFSTEGDDTELLVIVAEIDRHCRNHSEVISTIRNAVTTQHEVAVSTIVLTKTASIPKTSSGKIQRHACRHHFLEKTLVVIADADFNQLASTERINSSSKKEHTISTAEDIQQWIEQWLKVEFKLPLDQLTPHKTFVDYGLDSVSAAELATALDADMNHALGLEPELFWDYPTVGSFSQYVSNLINKGDAALVSLDSGDHAHNAYEKNAYEHIPQVLNRATDQQNRQVFIEERWISDFASCNYLGLDLHPQVQKAITPAIQQWGTHPSWTRAVVSPDLYRELESSLSTLLKAPDTLVFPSLSLLHMGVLPILAGKGGAIFLDNAAHRSVAEACALARQHGAQVISYRHNDLEDLASKLAQHTNVPVRLIAIDGVYSMSANYADLPSYVRLAKQFDATLYVDDAHGFGLVGEHPTPAMPYGQKGNGIVNFYGLRYGEDRIIYCAGLSKAFSSYGAFVTCQDAHMRQRLATAWTAIFSGPSPVASLASAIAGLRINQTEGDRLRQHIYDLTLKLVVAAREMGFEVDGQGYFPIVSVVVGSIESAIVACKILWEHNILITPGIFPAVPNHRSLLRFSITAANTEREIDQAIAALHAVHSRLFDDSSLP